MMVRWLKKILQLGVLLSLLLLTGCLQYDLDIQFDSQTHGQLVQQLHWRGGTANPDLQQWLEVLRDRTQLIGGQTQLLNNDTFQITVPFNNGKELETKFNQFFSPTDAELPLTLPGGDPIRAKLSLRQGNWLLAIYNHLTLRLDLTAVPDLTDTGLHLLQGKQLLEGTVTIAAPWVRSPSHDLTPCQTWPLIPGELNTLEADFWVPGPIGIGAAVIGIVVASGYLIKYGIRFK